jgi:dihydrofolate reductase
MRIVLIAAQSLDGFITQQDTPGSDFTSQADKTFFRDALRAFDCSISGANCYRATRDGYRRSLGSHKRLNLVLTRNPSHFEPDVVPDGIEFRQATAQQLRDELVARGRGHCALLGGSQIYRLFLDAKLVDELWLTLEPRLFGSGTPLVAGACDFRLKLISTEALSTDVLLLKYRPDHSSK